MKKAVLAALGALVALIGWEASANAQGFKICPGEFALCTTAPCEPDPKDPSKLLCQCTVNRGYSAGLKDCDDKRLKSRFFPISSYQTCKSVPSPERPWGWCLDVDCEATKNHMAVCRCDKVAGPVYPPGSNTASYPWIITTGQTTPDLCAPDNTTVYSSATQKDAQSVNAAYSDYFKTHHVEGTPLIEPVSVSPETK